MIYHPDPLVIAWEIHADALFIRYTVCMCRYFYTYIYMYVYIVQPVHIGNKVSSAVFDETSEFHGVEIHTYIHRTHTIREKEKAGTQHEETGEIDFAC